MGNLSQLRQVTRMKQSMIILKMNMAKKVVDALEIHNYEFHNYEFFSDVNRGRRGAPFEKLNGATPMQKIWRLTSLLYIVY